MSDFNWCHGPYCHQNKTVDRIRGVKGSKVLRTKKIPINTWNRETIWKLFCSQSCLMNFVHKHYREMIALEPRTEALETPIDVVVETRQDWRGNDYKTKVIKEVDNNLNP